jgi:hypothetical protein
MLGGKVDFIIMRLVEVFTAVPALMLALLLISVFGGGLFNVILALGMVAWLDACRLLRAQLLSLRERDFVLAARTLGVSNARIATRHLLPNAVAPLIVASPSAFLWPSSPKPGSPFWGWASTTRFPAGARWWAMPSLTCASTGTWASFPRWRSRSRCWASPFWATGCAMRSIRR